MRRGTAVATDGLVTSGAARTTASRPASAAAADSVAHPVASPGLASTRLEPPASKSPAPAKPKTIARRIVEAVAAPIVLFEVWGWEPLQRLIGKLSRFAPIRRLEEAISRLPPHAALLTFATPVAALFPLKLTAMWLLGGGHLLLGGALFVAAKVVSTAMAARLFKLTQPQLMQIPWFAKAYNRVVPWKNALVERIHATDAYKACHQLAEQVRAGFREVAVGVRDAVRTFLGGSRG